MRTVRHTLVKIGEDVAVEPASPVVTDGGMTAHCRL